MPTQIRQEVAARRPVPAPVTSSVLEHATVVDVNEFGLRNNEGLWPSYNCMDTLVPTELCPAPLQTVSPLDYASGEWQPAFEFGVYGAIKCHAVGLDEADQRAEVERVFARNEGKGVEAALLANRFVEDTGHEDEPWWDAPVDLTEDLSVPLSVALALLEGTAAAQYAGLPTIHMPRAAATVLEGSGLIVWDGTKAFTKNGSKVAIGGGYDVDLETGLWDLYATGEVYVERSTMLRNNAYVIPGDGARTAGDLDDNYAIAVAQRMYRVGIDCFVAKATGKVW